MPALAWLLLVRGGSGFPNHRSKVLNPPALFALADFIVFSVI
jgi:hypothetical protein